MKANLKRWSTIVPLSLGVFVLLNTLLWTILSGGRWFEFRLDHSQPLPEFKNAVHRIFGPLYMLAYFTIQTNLFLGLTLVVLACYNQSPRAQSWFVASNMLITITFLCYWTLLAPFNNPIEEWTSPYFVLSTTFTHGWNPLIGFGLLIGLRHRLVVNKRTLGRAALFMMGYFVFNAIVYGAGATTDGAGHFVGASIYGFLDIQKLFFLPLTNHPVLAIGLNLLLFGAAPFLAILIAWGWIKVLKLSSTSQSYYRWMEQLQRRRPLGPPKSN